MDLSLFHSLVLLLLAPKIRTLPKMLFFSSSVDALCSQGLLKLSHHHHGDQRRTGTLSNPSTAISYLLLYPQTSSTPSSISHPAVALLLIHQPSKKKNTTEELPHAPTTNPPHSLFFYFTGCFSSVSFVCFSILLNISFSWSDLETLPLFLDDFHINFPSRLSFRTLAYHLSPWCVYNNGHLKPQAPKWTLV